MSRQFTAVIEKDYESGMYIGTVISLPGAHTCANTLEELQDKLKEVTELCLEEMEEDEIMSLPIFEGISHLEIAV